MIFQLSRDPFDNNFALLTGLSPHLSYKSCDPTTNSYLDGCGFVWNAFELSGYITILSEDQVNQSSFNKHHQGFFKQPTDKYLRPYLMAVEKYLAPLKLHDIIHCVKSAPYVNHMFLMMRKLMGFKRDIPYFATFITNLFNDRQISTGMMMDNKLKENLFGLTEEMAGSETIIIYVGNSGLRMERGEIGMMEARNPMLFVHLPEKFQEKFPELTKRFKKNKNRLVTPYDLHVTLRHILKLATHHEVKLTSPGCKLCRSLFTEIPPFRRCSDLGIQADSCPCNFEKMKNYLPVVKNLVDLTLKFIKGKASKIRGRNCSKFEVSQINYVYKQKLSSKDLIYFVNLELTPGGLQYEATWKKKNFHPIWSSSPAFEIVDDWSKPEDFCVESH